MLSAESDEGKFWHLFSLCRETLKVARTPFFSFHLCPPEDIFKTTTFHPFPGNSLPRSGTLTAITWRPFFTDLRQTRWRW